LPVPINSARRAKREEREGDIIHNQNLKDAERANNDNTRNKAAPNQYLTKRR
jgi:hypothetical protein